MTTVTVETGFKINQENVGDGFRGYNNGLREQLTTIPEEISEHAKDSLFACYYNNYGCGRINYKSNHFIHYTLFVRLLYVDSCTDTYTFYW